MMKRGVLSGVKVVEVAGLAPAPFAGMILSDFGADVVRIDRVNPRDGSPVQTMDTLARGKRSVALNLKSEAGRDVLVKLASQADVLIEPFRPGVMERLGLGPDVLCEKNPKLIYARMTGFGQTGDPQVTAAAGHDQNYLAISGILSAFRRAGERPMPPVNLLGDFAGGGFVCAMGVLLALIERGKSGKGQIIDAAMVDGANYVSTFLFRDWMMGRYLNEHDEVGTNLLDTGAPFYDTYACKDGKFLSVGCLEPQFFKIFVEKLGLQSNEIAHQFDRDQWPEMKRKFESTLKTKTRDEWAKIFEGTDACTFPILSFDEAQKHKHNLARNSFAASADVEGGFEPIPAPRLSRTPGLLPRKSPEAGGNTFEVLQEYGFSKAEISKFVEEMAIGTSKL